MTNTIAFILAILIMGFIALDHFVLEWGVVTFWFRKLLDLIDYIAIWR
ncbi:hypothetical protein [Loktanella sp. S4079]|nr:hypothetical protein [Loktanella sp. S4079]